MNEPLKKSGIIVDADGYLLKWFYEDGTLYDNGVENKSILFDGDYNAFDPDDKPLIGKYFDDDGNEVKQTHFYASSVKSAVEGCLEEMIEQSGSDQYLRLRFKY